MLDWGIYAWSVFEFLCTLHLAPDYREFFRSNKLDLAVLPSVPQVLWGLRLLRLIYVVPVVLIGGVAAFAQQLLPGWEIGRKANGLEEDEVQEDVEGLLKDVRGLSATDRVLLQELAYIKSRPDEIKPRYQR